jgi:transcriptional regulator with XRE-family HTH domain
MMAKRLPRKPLSEALRAAIRSRGETMYRVAKDSGVPYATLHRFLAGKRSVSLEVFEKLCEYLNLELKERE